jgi:hypothetical protein
MISADLKLDEPHSNEAVGQKREANLRMQKGKRSRKRLLTRFCDDNHISLLYLLSFLDISAYRS